ncbi:hypothetical protein Prum_028910 [Phytohabitans rumicis]|uniref:Uncharacterized protein n=1 Tax=Phytohabitans rumicis TaxID=1076125 RepID=A0A6V8L3N0_9ACTN|nr:hypothetical protein Prum_028910 [Phytohabitans rumicis]
MPLIDGFFLDRRARGGVPLAAPGSRSWYEIAVRAVRRRLRTKIRLGLRASVASIKDFSVDQGQMVVDWRSKHDHMPLIGGLFLDRRGGWAVGRAGKDLEETKW